MYNNKVIFEYHIVPIKAMHEVQITRVVRDIKTNPTSLQFSNHKFPYLTLPAFQCHAQPHFVLFNTGKKLSRLDDTDLKQWAGVFAKRVGETSDTMVGIGNQIITMYKLWCHHPTSQPPPPVNQYLSDYGGPSGSGSSESGSGGHWKSGRGRGRSSIGSSSTQNQYYTPQYSW